MSQNFAKGAVSVPIGPAGGDLDGYYPTPGVAAIQGIPISTTPPTSNQFLEYNGSQWAPASFSATLAGDVTGTTGSTTVVNISGSSGIVTVAAIIEGNSSGSGFPISYGVTDVNMPSDANYTLTASQLTSPILRIMSNVSLTATRNITLPSQIGATYFIENKTTGGQSLSVAGTTVPNGYRIVLVNDGYGGTNYATYTTIPGHDLQSYTGGSYPNTGQTVIGIQGNPVSSSAATAGQFLVENTAANGSAWTTLSGDISNSTSTAGQLKVVGIDGYAISGGPSNGNILEYNGTNMVWVVPAPTTIWSSDLVNSTYTNQYVSSLSYGPGFTGGAIAINGISSSLVFSNANGGPLINQAAQASTGAGAGANGNPLTIAAQAGQATSVGIAGGIGGNLVLQSGIGGAYSGNINTPGNIIFKSGSSVAITLRSDIDGSDGYAAGPISLIFGNGSDVQGTLTNITPLITQARALISQPGSTFTVSAQDGYVNPTSPTGTGTAGGLLELLGGAGGSGLGGGGDGGAVSIIGGVGTGSHFGGAINITGGSAVIGANVNISGGIGSAGTYGSIILQSNTNTVTIDNSHVTLTSLTGSAIGIVTSSSTGVLGNTVPNQDGYLYWSGSAFQWLPVSGGTTVTGTGLWYSTSGSLNSAAITLTGDVSESALSGSNVPLEVTGLLNHALPSLTTGYLNWTGSAWALSTVSGGGITALTGDVTASGTGSVAATVAKIQGNAVANTALGSTQDGYVLTWVNASSQYQARPINTGFENHTITSSYTINSTQNDYNIFCNNSGAINLTVPVPVQGATFEIWDLAGTMETNNVTLVRHASENINGVAASRVLQTNWGHWKLICPDGTNWLVAG